MYGNMEGQGVNYHADGSKKYEGNWVNGNMEGHGVYYWDNGDRYEGYFVNDKKEGNGVKYNKDGTVKQKGEWKKNEFVE